MKDIYKYAKENNLHSKSAINHIEFREFFKKIDIKNLVEIGTYKGISATYMAQFANKIYTFDIEDYPEKYKVWKDLGLEDKIKFYLVKDKKEIKNILNNITFDFAFIDNGHKYEDVKVDFELVKRCRRVLFHDTLPGSWPEVNKFIDELGNVKIMGNIGYWIDIYPKGDEMILDLGCGKRKKEGFIGIDKFDWSNIYSKGEFICDHIPEVFKKFKDNSVRGVYASHIIEHIPQDLVIKTFNEIYRILILGGIFEIYVPPTQSPKGKACRGAFRDPTHRSYWNDGSFRYFDMSWDRELSESYGIKCNFKQVKIEFLGEYNLHTILKKVGVINEKKKEKIC